MTSPRIIQIESLGALRAEAEAWDDLWRRSDVTHPSLRAELLAQWVERFSRPDDFRAVVVEAAGRWTAALPIVPRRIARVLCAGVLPTNEWISCGDLLWDASDPGALESLAAAFRKMPWSLLWFDEIRIELPRWQLLHEAFVRTGTTAAIHPRWPLGCVRIDHDWNAYQARLSKKRRQKLLQAMRRLGELGDMRVDIRDRWTPDEAAVAVQQCLELENLGWKGASGTSVLRSNMADFFLRQADQASRYGQLLIARLYCGEQIAAFCYGLFAKGVFHSMKIGYDPQYARQQPGQLLRYFLLERFFTDPERKISTMDFQGPMTEAHAAWLPEHRMIGRMVFAPRGLLGRLAVAAYRDVWPHVRRWRQLSRGG